VLANNPPPSPTPKDSLYLRVGGLRVWCVWWVWCVCWGTCFFLSFNILALLDVNERRPERREKPFVDKW